VVDGGRVGAGCRHDTTATVTVARSSHEHLVNEPHMAHEAIGNAFADRTANRKGACKQVFVMGYQ
jgi:hypothetical protein